MRMSGREIFIPVREILGMGTDGLEQAPASGPPATVMAKPAVGAQVVHHPQLVGQTVLNPVTMVTMPSFPVSTLKLA